MLAMLPFVHRSTDSAFNNPSDSQRNPQRLPASPRNLFRPLSSGTRPAVPVVYHLEGGQSKPLNDLVAHVQMLVTTLDYQRIVLFIIVGGPTATLGKRAPRTEESPPSMRRNLLYRRCLLLRWPNMCVLFGPI